MNNIITESEVVVRMRVLIAEDNNLTILGVSLIVEKLGHEVVAVASDGKEAVELILKERPDLVLMDINMPEKSGIEVLEIVRQEVDTPCIFITAYSDENFIKEASRLGAIGYVIKPVTEEQLKAQIELGIHQKQHLDEARNETSYYKQALKERKTIERAKGILMDRLQIKEAEAMRRIQKRSRDENKKMIVVAQEIIKADNYFK